LKVIRYIFRRAIHSPRAPQKMTPGCFTFCFVREPLKWYESWWRFRQMNKWRPLGDESDFHRWYPTSTLNGLGSPDFNTFMHNVNRKRPGFVTEMYGWYVRPGVTFVGKQESLKRDLLEAFALMKLPIDPARIDEVQPQNETDKTIAAPEWDPALRKETLRFEYTGYIRYGYQLPVPFD
jgi:hypothetical protein